MIVQNENDDFQRFPVEALPPTLRAFVDAVAESYGCDPAFAALPALAACASAIGTSRQARARADWAEPCILWMACIGRSGTMKSPPMDAALQPLRKIEGESFRTHAAEMEQYRRDVEIHERERAAWKKSKSEGDPPAQPDRPACIRYTTSDATTEALAVLLQENPRGLLMTRDELAGLLKSFDAYRGGKGGDAERWLELYRAGVLLVDRKTGDRRVIRVERAAVSVSGTIQPGVLARLLTSDSIESGLASRFLFAHPPARKKVWRDSPVPESVRNDYHRTIRGLLALEPNEGPDGPEPRDVHLATEARDRFACWYDSFADQQAEAESDAIAAALSKIEGVVLRLALVHHLCRYVNGETLSNSIEPESVEAAITLGEYFAGEARRLYAVLAESVDERQQRELVEWIASRGGDVSVNETRKRFAKRYPTSEDAHAALNDLYEHGHGEFFYAGPGANGGRPSERFRLSQGKTETSTPADGAKNKGLGFGHGVERPELNNGTARPEVEVIA